MATSGLTYYDLETRAKFLYPLLTPLRNEIARVSGKGGIQANWRAVTGINTTGLRIGVSGGNRGGVQAVSTQDYSAAYKGIGIETSLISRPNMPAWALTTSRPSAPRSGSKPACSARSCSSSAANVGGARHHADADARR